MTTPTRSRPVRAGDVDTGPNSLEAVRQRLQGSWDLVSATTYAASGEPTERRATGRLTYDQFGNLTVQARVEEEGAVGSPGSELPFLNISGRAVIDTANQRLVFTNVGANAPLDNALPAEVALDRVRYYEFVDDLLTLSVRNSDGSVSAILTWRKIGG